MTGGTGSTKSSPKLRTGIVERRPAHDDFEDGDLALLTGLLRLRWVSAFRTCARSRRNSNSRLARSRAFGAGGLVRGMSLRGVRLFRGN
jgi:hypothetical protein